MTVARDSLQLARASFWIVVILAPFRFVIATISRDVPGVSHDYSDLRLIPVHVATAVLLCAWLVALVAGRRRPARPSGWATGAGLVLLALIWIGVPGSLDPGLSLTRALAITAFAGLGLYVATEVRTARDLAYPVLVMLIGQAGVAIVQVLTQGSLGLEVLGEHVLDPQVHGISVVTSMAGVRFLRAYGLTDHPNILGGMLVMGLIAVVAGLAEVSSRGSRIGMFVMAAIATLALALTFSRGAWIALIGGALIAALLVARSGGLRAARPWFLLAGALPLVLAALWVPLGPYLFARFDTDADRPATETRSYDERLALSGAALRVVAAHPLLGTGIGTLPQALSSDSSLRYPPQAAHLVPLEIAAESGLPAATAYVLLIVLAVAAAAKSAARSGAALGTSAMAGALLVAITAIGLFDHYPWTSPAGSAWLAIAIGACLGRFRASRRGVLPGTNLAGAAAVRRLEATP